MINFAHFADTHLNREGKETFLNADVLKNFEAAIDSLKPMTDTLDFIVITGDVVHEGDVEDYRFLRELVRHTEEKLNTSVFLTLGNHDNRESFFEGYLNQPSRTGYFESHNIRGLRLILLDTKQGEHTVTGKLTKEQLDWLKDELQTPAKLGTIIALHHPPDSATMPDHCLENPEFLREIIAGTDVIGILSGHTHGTDQHIFSDRVQSVTAASTAFSFFMENQYIHMTDRCSYTLGTVTSEGKMHVTNVQLPKEEKTLASFSFAEMQKMLSDEFDPSQYKDKKGA